MKAPSTEATEAQWQETVIAAMRALGWSHNFTRKSIGKHGRWVTATSCVGWPDLTAWNERQQRVLFVELKSDTGRLTDQQDRVLASLAAAGAEVRVWRPSDWESVQADLKGEL